MVLMQDREIKEKIASIINSFNEISIAELRQILDYLTDLIQYKQLKIELARKGDILRI